MYAPNQGYMVEPITSPLFPHVIEHTGVVSPGYSPFMKIPPSHVVYGNGRYGW